MKFTPIIIGSASAMLVRTQAGVGTMIDPSVQALIDKATGTDGGDDLSEFPHWMNGFGGYRTYMRDIPDRFETESDDTLMRSLYENYATEGADGSQLPNGHYWVTKKNAEAVSREVIGTHLGIKGEAADAYIAETFEPLYAKYDVNEEGFLDIDRMPAFLRSICGNAEACLGLQ